MGESVQGLRGIKDGANLFAGARPLAGTNARSNVERLRKEAVMDTVVVNRVDLTEIRLTFPHLDGYIALSLEQAQQLRDALMIVAYGKGTSRGN